MQSLRAKYSVRESNEKVIRTKHRMTENGLESYEVEEPRGYIVSIPNRHEFVVRSFDELKALGLDKDAPLFDEAGEIDERLINMIAGRVQQNMAPPQQAKKGS